MLRSFGAIVVALAVGGGAHGVDPIPPFLVGVWATDGAVLKGPLLFEGQALYLGADGIGAIVGGSPPIGFKIVASFNAEKGTIEFDAYEGNQRGPHGMYFYDPGSGTIDSGTPQHQLLRRRYDTLSDETKHALGLK